MVIDICVKDKLAKVLTKNAFAVCGNSDYEIRFDFDDEWAAYDTKTARFRYAGSFTDILFSGDSCTMPIIQNASFVEIGVFAGNLHTTTPAYIPLIKSITSAGGTPEDPPESVYNQLMELIKGIGTISPEDIDKAVEAYLEAHPIKETDPTVPAWAKAEERPTYTAAEVGAVSQSGLQAATDAALAQAKASGAFDGPQGPQGPEGPRVWRECI